MGGLNVPRSISCSLPAPRNQGARTRVSWETGKEGGRLKGNLGLMCSEPRTPAFCLPSFRLGITHTYRAGPGTSDDEWSNVL
jgi:hypothetical protein